MERLTIQLSEDLRFVLDEIQRRERYRSPSEVVQSFLRHWSTSQQNHHVTGEWAALTPAQRDEIDAGCRKLVESGKGQKGSWLKALIYDCIKELNGMDAKTPTVDQVLTKLPEAARRALKKLTP
jgi:Arc/MetJ-type ribon-helix-helix transcriptional regulator